MERQMCVCVMFLFNPFLCPEWREAVVASYAYEPQELGLIAESSEAILA